MESLLFVGFVFGMRHAIESDHIAAIASLTDQSRGLRAAARIGVVWGVGHTLILFAVGGAMLIMNSSVPDNMATMLGWFAGLMLVLFGLDVIRRVFNPVVYFNSYIQRDDLQPVQSIDKGPDKIPPQNNSQLQAQAFPHRAFIAGLIHGLAGSAALVLLTLGSVKSVWVGLGYILIFCLGSIIGMGILSMAIALPLNKMKNMYAIYKLICIVGGLFTIIVGALLLREHTNSLVAML